MSLNSLKEKRLSDVLEDGTFSHCRAECGLECDNEIMQVPSAFYIKVAASIQLKSYPDLENKNC